MSSTREVCRIHLIHVACPTDNQELVNQAREIVKQFYIKHGPQPLPTPQVGYIERPNGVGVILLMIWIGFCSVAAGMVGWRFIHWFWSR